MTTKQPRFCIINCEDSDKWSPRSFCDMFRDGFQEKDDEWLDCWVAKGEKLPADILGFNGIIITGSRFNCRDNHPWYESICEVIRAAAQQGTPKIYAGCFGCQLVACTLGGEVDFNPGQRFVLKAETITLTSEFNMNLPIAPDLWEKWSARGTTIIASHGDCVRSLPPGAKLLGYSSSCANEIFLCGEKNNILACQSHPEFEFKYAIEERIWPSVVETRKKLAPNEIEEAKQSFEHFDGIDSKHMLDLIRIFLHLP